jgi:hypothetical protein
LVFRVSLKERKKDRKPRSKATRTQREEDFGFFRKKAQQLGFTEVFPCPFGLSPIRLPTFLLAVMLYRRETKENNLG